MSTHANRTARSQRRQITSTNSARPTPRGLEFDRDDLIRSIEISEDDILADLLYPFGHHDAPATGTPGSELPG